MQIIQGKLPENWQGEDSLIRFTAFLEYLEIKNKLGSKMEINFLVIFLLFIFLFFSYIFISYQIDKIKTVYKERDRFRSELYDVQQKIKKYDAIEEKYKIIVENDDLKKNISALDKRKTEIEDFESKTHIDDIISFFTKYSGIPDELKQNFEKLWDIWPAYPPDWETRKSKVKKRDGYMCAECKSKKDIDVHHIIELCNGGKNIEDNLICLCIPCHQKKHSHDILNGREYYSREQVQDLLDEEIIDKHNFKDDY